METAVRQKAPAELLFQPFKLGPFRAFDVGHGNHLRLIWVRLGIDDLLGGCISTQGDASGIAVSHHVSPMRAKACRHPSWQARTRRLPEAGTGVGQAEELYQCGLD
jgi:hypothetical protein